MMYILGDTLLLPWVSDRYCVDYHFFIAYVFTYAYVQMHQSRCGPATSKLERCVLQPRPGLTGQLYFFSVSFSQNEEG